MNDKDLTAIADQLRQRLVLILERRPAFLQLPERDAADVVIQEFTYVWRKRFDQYGGARSAGKVRKTPAGVVAAYRELCGQLRDAVTSADRRAVPELAADAIRRRVAVRR